MNTQSTLFSRVKYFYNNLLCGLKNAQDVVSMMYYTFDHGEWAEKISRILCAKAAAGVRVRLMVDEFGLVLDEPKHALQNQVLIRDLVKAGVQVDVFRPAGYPLSKLKRLHFKVCAIDHCSAFIGGSNIGDHYVRWDDSNLRLDGRLGATFHQVYDFLGRFSLHGSPFQGQPLHLSNLTAGDARVWLTLPKQCCDIRQALLGLILDADKSVHIRSWYFLPDPEVLNALRSQAENGVEVKLLLSHRTRIPPIDIANYIPCHKLAQSGGRVYRYTRKYMHAKVAWNNSGEVLFGSANMDTKSLTDNFECNVALQDHKLAWELLKVFEVDKRSCFLQTPELFRRRPLPQKALSFTCNLASQWM